MDEQKLDLQMPLEAFTIKGKLALRKKINIHEKIL